jgi:hypothetical protein
VIPSKRCGWLWAVVALACAVAWGTEQSIQLPAATGKAGKPAPLKTPPAALAAGPRPAACPTPSREAIDSAIQHGISFLLTRQNRDGSWGSAHQTKGLDIYAPVPGAHQAFRTGVTALCIAALIETARDAGEVAAALDRAEGWLLEHLPKLRRATPDAIYNNWGHAYGIHALAVMLQRRPGDQARAERIRTAIGQQIDLLGRYECVDGGWCYYDFVAHTQQPSGSSISFVSATSLISLKEAERAGVKSPDRLVRRAVASIQRQRKPDFSYCYGEYLKYRPMHPVNRPGGSLGRSQVCNLALRLWGDPTVTDEVLRVWLDRLFARNLWLDIGRKRPIPHESWFAVAGYFFYFGHYYAARCIEELPPSERSSYQDHLGQVLLHLQEKDGSWWDFPLYDYHQQYGTAFALMSLKRCVK